MNFDDLIKEEEPTSMGVVGSRNWPSKEFVDNVIAAYLRKYPSIKRLVSGGQPQGVDGWAASYAKEHGLELIEYLPAHWYDSDDERYLPFAYSNFFTRNTQIAQDSDILLAFCWHSSRGTMDTYKKAKARISDRAKLITEKHL